VVGDHGGQGADHGRAFGAGGFNNWGFGFAELGRQEHFSLKEEEEIGEREGRRRESRWQSRMKRKREEKQRKKV